jgi:3-oxoacyl-[acyl-carrier-protein] synthase II
VAKNWDALMQGKSGVDRITRFDASDLPTQIAGEVKDFNAEDFIPKKETKKMDLFIQYALAAAEEAMQDSGLQITEANAERVGVLVGAGLGGLPAIEKYHQAQLEGGYKKISPFFIPMLIINLAPGQISMRYGAKGPNLSSVSACATGTHSIGDAYHMIKRGDADAMIAGGAESTITPLGIGGFNVMRALSTRNDDPQAASRPFEKNRDGFIMAEGAGIVILEEYDSAVKRGARIYGEIAGYGLTADAYHLTAPAPGGEGAARCMKMALNNGGVAPEAVDYINAHGTSTHFNDLYETLAIKTVFGDHAGKLMVSSTKSMTGHALGAAGGIEAVYSLLAMLHGAVPPTINYEEPDPECDLDYVPNTPRESEVKVTMSNSFGFGGTNATLLFKKV